MTLSASSLRRTAIVRVVQEARPSVVSIHGRKTVRSSGTDHSADGFKQVNGMGTGIVIDDRGYVITNYHVIEGVRQIQVTLDSTPQPDGSKSAGKTVLGKLIAHDPTTDLAIIKIDVGAPMQVIRMGTSGDLMTGEPVVAIGNAYGYDHTVTRGIISALHRPVEVSDTQKYLDLIQTDASINPGNSGGPLLNIDGEMIGINVAVRVGAQGIGFAVPIDQAIDVAAELMDSEVAQHIDHGITGRTVAGTESSRFIVDSVATGSPAESAGIRRGDIISTVGNISVQRSLDFERALIGRKPGESIGVAFEQGGESRRTQIVLAAARRNTSRALAHDQSWDVLGVKLAPISESTFGQLRSRYRGGLRVVAVRNNGPAHNQGIRYGDILVGLHKWETVSVDNMEYILESGEFSRAQPVKFYILREGDTLYGHLNVASLDG
jgi:serine protease Do